MNKMKNITPNSIVLLTFHTRKGQHSLALKYFERIADKLGYDVTLLEYGIEEGVKESIEEITKIAPDILILSLYIWNREIMAEVAGKLREKISPFTIVGGPEVMGDRNGVERDFSPDILIMGEGEVELKGCSPNSKMEKLHKIAIKSTLFP